MKSLLKGLLVIGLLLGGIYVASPLWLSPVLQRQLPLGWTLQHLDIEYPGFASAGVKKLRLQGGAAGTVIDLTVTGARFEYQSRNAQIDALVVDIYLPTAKDLDIDPDKVFSLDDLTLPPIKLPPGLQLPEIRVQQLRVNLHIFSDTETSKPLVLDFSGFTLKPSQENSYHLISGINLVGYAAAGGQLEVEMDTKALTAELKFFDASISDPWLAISLDQQILQPLSQTNIQLEFKAAATDRGWLDGLLGQISAGRLQHADGEFILQLGFSGENEQKISSMGFDSESLQLESADESLKLDVGIRAQNAFGKIQITQKKTIEIQYQSNTNQGLLAAVLPGLVHRDRTRQAIDIRLNNLELELQATDGLGLNSAEGLLELEWQEAAAFKYESTDFSLQADTMKLKAIGALSIHQQRVNFEHLGNLDLQLDNMQLQLLPADSEIKLSSDAATVSAALDFDFSLKHPDLPLEFDLNGDFNLASAVLTLAEHSEPHTKISTNAISLSAEISSHAGSLLSSGRASLIDTKITDLIRAVDFLSTDGLDLNWEQLDILNLSGRLDAHSSGLVLEIEGGTWQGFELDLQNQFGLHGKLKGSGKLLLDSSTELPLNYSGNTQTGKWQLNVPATVIEVAQLPAFLTMAHIEFPDILKLRNGRIVLSAEISISDQINVAAGIKGEGISLSILENNIQGSSFNIEALLDKDLKFEGPISIAKVDVAGGLQIHNIQTKLIIDGLNSLRAEKLQLQLFGGRLKPAILHYTKGVLEDTTLELKSIDLQLLLEFADIDGLEGTGSLDINLPIGSDAAGLYVHNATFSSIKPGRLAYLSGVPGGNIGLQALENFQYQSLTGTLDYQSDGNYQILISLNGNNPDLYSGHPIAFKLNIGGVLPELFEALFITGSFEDGIIKQIRSQ